MKIISNITSGHTAFFAGSTILHRVMHVAVEGRRLGSRKLFLKLNNGDQYVIKQLDRGCFEVEGPHYSGPVTGWADGARLINSI